MEIYQFIFWDLDQTLLDFKKSQQYALSHAFSHFYVKCTLKIQKHYDQINDGYWKRYERGEIRKEEVMMERFITLFQDLDINGIPIEIFQSIYQTALGEVFYFIDEADQLLTELGETHRQFIVTNGIAETQISKLKLSGLDQLVEKVFISEEVGIPKPNKRFFDRCFAEIPDFSKEKAIIIGDSLSSDMKGGNNAKIATCWYNPTKKKNDTNTRVNFEIKNLWDVKGIL